MNVHFCAENYVKHCDAIASYLWRASSGVYIFVCPVASYCFFYFALTLTSHKYTHKQTRTHTAYTLERAFTPFEPNIFFVFVFTKPDNIALQKSRVKNTLRQNTHVTRLTKASDISQNRVWTLLLWRSVFMYLFARSMPLLVIESPHNLVDQSISCYFRSFALSFHFAAASFHLCVYINVYIYYIQYCYYISYMHAFI